MKRYTITVFKEYPKTKFYTISLDGEKNNETDKFLLRFANKNKFKKEIELIKYWFEKIGNDIGAQERCFRPEGRANAIPIPPPSSKLRLYCYRLTDEIVILGNGGKKSSQRVQDSPDAYPHFEQMNLIVNLLKYRLKNSSIRIEGKELIGNLDFKEKKKK